MRVASDQDLKLGDTLRYYQRDSEAAKALLIRRLRCLAAYEANTSTFTVDGKEVTEYDADVDTDPEFKGDTNVIEDGAFMESKFRSAPYFDLEIDGIELLDTKF